MKNNKKNNFLEQYSGWDWLGKMLNDEGTYLPPEYMIFGKKNEGMVPVGGPDGVAVMKPYNAGSGGFAPDYTTIGLTANSQLAVIDYISATGVRQLLADYMTLNTAQTVAGRKTFTEAVGVGPNDQGVGVIVSHGKLIYSPDNGVHKYNINFPEKSGTMAVVEDIPVNYIKSITKSGDTYTATRQDDTTIDWNQGGGGSAEPVYVIIGTATITDPTSLIDIPINITSTNIYNELSTFDNLNNRLPRIIMKLSLSYEGTIISNIFIDLIANAVDQNSFSLAGSSNDLSSSGISVSYVDINIKPTEQTGSLTATPLQTKLTADSEFSARKINIGRYFVTETVMEALNHLLSGAVLLDTNQDISGTKTFTSSFGIKVSDTPNVETHYKNGSVEVAHIVTGKTDHFNFPNKDGGTYTLATTNDLPSTTKSYLHCIEVLDDNNNINFYLRFINHSNTTYTSWSQLISETKKMWGWGRTNQQASTYHRYDVTAMGDNGTVLFIDEENNTYDLEEVNVTSITDRGCEEL